VKELIRQAFKQAEAAAVAMASDEVVIEAVDKAGELLVNAIRKGSHIFSCGNGGSMSDAMHFAEELSGRFRANRKALPATAISDPAHITCVGNDFGFDEIFARYLEANAREGDVVLAISTSGKSPNIMRAAQTAKAIGAQVVALTGRTNTPLEDLADVTISTHMTQSPWSDRIQELHIKVIHTLIEICEKEVC
jgi:D-sedoheptulose 7-phosphate isomerase